MANEAIFSSKAVKYAASRPAYAPEAVKKIFTCMISAGERAADAGSGTGIFSREFLIRGYDVYCVEPNPAMRAEAERLYGSCPGFHSIAASAEDTGLPAHSVSLVTAASAFHWFDPQSFYRECRRILKPGGTVCLIANARRHDAFTQRQHELCRRYCRGYTSLTHGIEKVMQTADRVFKGGYHLETYDFPLHYTKGGFIARSLSSSYAPDEGAGEYEAYAQALQRLLDDAYPGSGSITIANETVMLWGRPGSDAP